jgi:hypothetical protein
MAKQIFEEISSKKMDFIYHQLLRHNSFSAAARGTASIRQCAHVIRSSDAALLHPEFTPDFAESVQSRFCAALVSILRAFG